MSHVDLHLHLLPGVDDGPEDEAASLTHAARLAEGGVHEATVTPHVGHPWFPIDVGSIPERTRALQAAIDDAGLDLRLHPGGEIYPEGATSLNAAQLDVIAHGAPGARWVLLEVPFAGIDEAYLESCAYVRACGFELLIGHPERAHGFLAERPRAAARRARGGRAAAGQRLLAAGPPGPRGARGRDQARARGPRLRARLRRPRRQPRAHARGGHVRGAGGRRVARVQRAPDRPRTRASCSSTASPRSSCAPLRRRGRPGRRSRRRRRCC